MSRLWKNRSWKRSLWEGKLGVTPDADPMKTAAEWTLSAYPLPQPSAREYDNLSVNQTLLDYLELFEIITPVKVSVLEQMMWCHPNRAFIESMLEGLRDGFWPWAMTAQAGYPVTHDESRPIQLLKEKEQFLEKQMKHELCFTKL